MKHKWFLMIAGRRLGVSWWRILIHDWSKLSPVERRARRSREDFARAWLHHVHHNPHHWEYWVILSKTAARRADGTAQGAAIDMPEKFIREMVADWWAATVCSSNSRPRMDNWTWLIETFPQIPLSPRTAQRAWKLCEQICDSTNRHN